MTPPFSSWRNPVKLKTGMLFECISSDFSRKPVDGIEAC
jgi:hypothetical protein